MSYSEAITNVVPVVFSSEIKYTCGFRYAVAEFDVNKRILFRVLLIDQHGQPLEVKMVELSGTNYTSWGNDDSYLLNFIASSLGFTLSNSLFNIPTAFQPQFQAGAAIPDQPQ